MSIVSDSGTLFINGEWFAGAGETLVSENPQTGESIWQGNTATKDDVHNAVVAAKSAFFAWSRLTVDARMQFIERYADVIKAEQQGLAELIHIETGKPLWETKTEAASVLAKIGLSVDAYHKRTGTTHNEQAAMTATLTHRAHGVMAVLGPYNFPAHLPNGHIVPALIAGNTLVLKPSEFTPRVAEFMVRCWEKAGLPAGVLNLVQGKGDTGAALAQHNDIDGLLFTGSSTTGAKLHAMFGGQPHKMLALEMGGNNPLVVYQSRNIEAAVYTIIQSAFLSSGQRCTCARRLILQNNDEGRVLLEALVAATRKIKVGRDDDAFMGPVINLPTAERLLAAQAQWLANGAHAALEMTLLEAGKPFLSPGIIDVTDMQDRQDEEWFGPLLQVIFVDSLDAAVDEANNTRFGLSAGLLSDSAEVWQTFLSRAHAGIINWNRQTTGASGAAPFGGVGASGNHRPSAFYAADYCAYPIASLQSEALSMPETLTPGISL